jgi:DnaK suppressor protein
VSDELTEPQLATLKTLLLTLQTDLTAALAENADSTDVVDLDQPIGRLSRMDAMQQQKMARANKARAEVRLDRIRVALTDMREDAYGECKRCEEFISFKRLEAGPETPFCLACQREFEVDRKGR